MLKIFKNNYSYFKSSHRERLFAVCENFVKQTKDVYHNIEPLNDIVYIVTTKIHNIIFKLCVKMVLLFVVKRVNMCIPKGKETKRRYTL